jgi:hypothetical protein
MRSLLCACAPAAAHASSWICSAHSCLFNHDNASLAPTPVDLIPSFFDPFLERLVEHKWFAERPDEVKTRKRCLTAFSSTFALLADEHQ